MAPNYNFNLVAKDYPFMTCLVKVNTRSSWQRTVTKVLNKCHGIYSFRMDDHGVVEIAGAVDPSMLLKMLGKSGNKAELRWLQFGECSSNLFMPVKHTNNGGYYGGPTTYSQDGRYLHSGDLTRPKLPSQVSLRSTAHNQTHHNYQDYYDQYAHNHNNQDYYPLSSDYNQAYDYGHDYPKSYDYGYDCNHNDYRQVNQNYGHGYRGEDIECCTIM
ncbi:hypothetical protein ACP275_13G104600 [Erythranthe tilingii]